MTRSGAAPRHIQGTASGFHRGPAELRRERPALPLDGARGAALPPGAAGPERADGGHLPGVS